MVKKLILSILIILSIFNLILPNSFVNASESRSESFGEVMNGTSEDTIDDMLYDGEATAHPEGGSQTKKLETTPSFGGATASALAKLLNNIPTIISIILNTIVNTEQSPGQNTIEFSIYDLVYNKYDLFSIDFFSDPSTARSQTGKDIRTNVAIWYSGVRNLAIVISLLILVYVGIRMAISTLAEDKAKYKKMLINWVLGFCLIFVMNWILIIGINLSNALLEILPQSSDNLELAILYGNGGTMDTASSDADSVVYKLKSFKGWNYVAISVLYFMIIYYQLKFFLIYFKRVLVMGFMIIISPLVSATYAIDSISDGEAQAFKKWFSDIMVNIFIQPIHAIIYSVIIVSAGAIIEVAPVLAILFFAGLSRAEKVVKNVFGLRNRPHIMNSLGSIKLHHR